MSRSVSRMKSQIIEELGQADILLPSLVAEGLAANDRIKVRMSALQAAHSARAGSRIVRPPTCRWKAAPPA